MVAMLSAEATVAPAAHLHLDPTLEVEVPVKARCNTCCPLSAIFKKMFCCFSSECCNKTTTIQRDRIIYCDSKGNCVEFDPSKSTNQEEDYKKTADRVKTIVEQSSLKRGSVIRSQTGVDLEQKSARGEPLRLHELKRLQTI